MPRQRRKLTVEDRVAIDLQRKDGWGVRAIARELGRSPSVISAVGPVGESVIGGSIESKKGGRIHHTLFDEDEREPDMACKVGDGLYQVPGVIGPPGGNPPSPLASRADFMDGLFYSKAVTLEKLRNRIISATILPMLTFDSASWHDDSGTIISRIIAD